MGINMAVLLPLGSPCLVFTNLLFKLLLKESPRRSTSSQARVVQEHHRPTDGHWPAQACWATYKIPLVICWPVWMCWGWRKMVTIPSLPRVHAIEGVCRVVACCVNRLVTVWLARHGPSKPEHLPFDPFTCVTWWQFKIPCWRGEAWPWLAEVRSPPLLFTREITTHLSWPHNSPHLTTTLPTWPHITSTCVVIHG